MLGWSEYTAPVHGVKVEGDLTVLPTRTWLDHLLGILYRWKRITVLEVDAYHALRGYRIGYISYNGQQMIQGKVLHDRRFRVRNGHEDCIFFAVDAVTGVEVRLGKGPQTNRNDPDYRSLPLY